MHRTLLLRNEVVGLSTLTTQRDYNRVGLKVTRRAIFSGGCSNRTKKQALVRGPGPCTEKWTQSRKLRILREFTMASIAMELGVARQQDSLRYALSGSRACFGWPRHIEIGKTNEPISQNPPAGSRQILLRPGRDTSAPSRAIPINFVLLLNSRLYLQLPFRSSMPLCRQFSTGKISQKDRSQIGIVWGDLYGVYRREDDTWTSYFKIRRRSLG
jgi:hypothetical protein